MQEPGQLESKKFYKKWQFWLMAVSLLLLILLVSALSGGDKKTTDEPDFNQLAQERFNQIKQSAPEIDSIECENNNDCNSGGSTVYLNFNKLTDDLQTVIRGNTATYSKFRMDNNKGSNVGVYARYQGKIVFQCEGLNGAVKECK